MRDGFPNHLTVCLWIWWRTGVVPTISLIFSFLIISHPVLLTALFKQRVSHVVILRAILLVSLRLALAGQSRDEYRVYEFGFCLHWDVRMFEEGDKLVADIVCLLDSGFYLSIESAHLPPAVGAWGIFLRPSTKFHRSASGLL